MPRAVRLAVRLGLSSVTICSDSEVALAQVLSLRTCSHLQHQQAVLRSLARVSGLVVRLVWVPSDLEPGDSMSRVNSEHEGSQARAEVMAWDIWQRMLSHLDACKVRWRPLFGRLLRSGGGGGGGGEVGGEVLRAERPCPP